MRRDVPKGDITKHGQAQMPRALGLGPWQVTSEHSIRAPSRSGSWIMTFPLPCEARAGGECEADTVHAQPPAAADGGDDSAVGIGSADGMSSRDSHWCCVRG